MDAYSAHGAPFALGRALGERACAAFAEVIRPNPAFERLRRRVPYGWLADVAARIRADFPNVWNELQGLAAGLEQPFEDVLVWNCRGDITPTDPEGCSSVAAASSDGIWLAHNGDGDPALREHCFLVDAVPDDGPAFFTFCYPGSLPGHTLAMNAAGLAYTVNNLRLTQCPTGIPRMVTARALLTCSGVEEALAVLRRTRRTGGFHFMMADSRHRAPVSVEAPIQRVSVEAVATVSAHANHLVHPDCAHLPQRITDSSRARQARLNAWREQLNVPATPDALLAILGDHSDAVLPVHRTDPNDPDGENTLATAVFRVDTGGVTASVRTAPNAPVSAKRRFTPT
ncbi:C45 family autoproteolytic acyltransferase/hydolase [Arhodomonas sp. AD133]|uniref:C45 family autoproteolytic acyltransferase/hydolase n=1 Tax=Arhodomonas sp. AD133 TaxID=3415009 RepID=UPI003EC0629E